MSLNIFYIPRLKLDMQYISNVNEANFFDGIRARQTIPGEL